MLHWCHCPLLKNNDGPKCVFYPLSFSSDIKSSVKIVANVGVNEQRKKMKLSNVKTGRDAGKLFPRLISYFENHIAKSWPTVCNEHSHIRESPNARIYKIIYYDQENPILVIAIASNNYCLNIQGRHAKNNIFFNINVGEFFYTQKCHDHMCKDYQSDPIPLDPALFFSTKQERDNY